MNKHPFLSVDYQSSVALSGAEKKQLNTWLKDFSEVARFLIKKKIIPIKNLKQIQVSLLICGDHKMRGLNKKFRNKDKTTDVLSFPVHQNLRKLTMSQSVLFLGDLAISFPQLKRQAKEFSLPWSDEFVHLFFHGFLHLLGFDHEVSLKEEKLMEYWENLAIKKASTIKKKHHSSGAVNETL